MKRLTAGAFVLSALVAALGAQAGPAMVPGPDKALARDKASRSDQLEPG
jgi:hypothetical protein